MESEPRKSDPVLMVVSLPLFPNDIHLLDPFFRIAAGIDMHDAEHDISPYRVALPAVCVALPAVSRCAARCVASRCQS